MIVEDYYTPSKYGMRPWWLDSQNAGPFGRIGRATSRDVLSAVLVICSAAGKRLSKLSFCASIREMRYLGPTGDRGVDLAPFLCTDVGSGPDLSVFVLIIIL